MSSRLVRASILLSLVLALAISTLPTAISVFFPGVEPNVGWNRGVTSYAPPADVAWVLPRVQPCIGWNT
jgi:hypothetical protein